MKNCQAIVPESYKTFRTRSHTISLKVIFYGVAHKVIFEYKHIYNSQELTLEK
jgi:hypothetical protein